MSVAMKCSECGKDVMKHVSFLLIFCCYFVI